LIIAYVAQPTWENHLSDIMNGYIWHGKYFPNIHAQQAIKAFSIIHLIGSSLWIGVYLWSWAPVIVFRARQDFLEELKTENASRKKSGLKESNEKFGVRQILSAILTDYYMIYHITYFVLAAVGVYWTPILAFHLLDISARSESTKQVLKAVTTNGSSILLTALLAALMIYLYTVIGFFAFSGSFESFIEDNCDTLYYCLVFFLNFGIRSGGGIGDALGNAPGPSESQYYIGRAIFDITFFMLIIIISLNVIFGIIIDTFGQLRDQRNEMEEDMQSICFICGLDGDTFQRQALGFKNHTKFDHNVWNYLYYLIYLDEKEEDEYTYVEEYVSEKMKNGESDFFPLTKALCLLPNVMKKKLKGTTK